MNNFENDSFTNIKTSPNQGPISPSMSLNNSQYRRPTPIISSPSVASLRRNKLIEDDRPLISNIMGRIFLSLHMLIATLTTLIAFIVVIFEIISMSSQKKIFSVDEIPEFVLLILASLSLVGLVSSMIIPMKVLFANEMRFKRHCYKDNTILKYSSLLILSIGIICVILHIWLSKHLNPFLPAGMYLIFNSLLNLKLHHELIDCGMTEQTIMLPFVIEKERDENVIEESEITGSDSV